MPKARLLTDNMVQDIYEVLTEKSQRSLEKYHRPKALPKYKVEGELVLFLDDLLEFASSELQIDPEIALSELVDLGIVYWYMSLDKDLRESLGLPKIIADDENNTQDKTPQAEENPINKKDTAKLTAEVKKLKAELEKEKEQHAAGMEKLLSEKEEAQSEVFQLKQKLRELNQILDQSESDQLQTISQNHDALSGNSYTPMTAHAFNGDAPKTNKKPPKNKRNKKKRGFGIRPGSRGHQ
jgi:hypothetical protein